MADTLNDQLLSREISHQIDLHRLSNKVVARLLAILNRADADIFSQLTVVLAGMSPTTFSVTRLDQLFASVQALNAGVYARLAGELPRDLRQLSDYEAGYQLQLFESLVPDQVSVAMVNLDQVYAAAMSRPFQGRLLSEWMAGLEADRAKRIRDAIRIGYIENNSTDQIVRNIRGTRANSYSDGIIAVDRRNAEAVARTALSHTSGFARDRFLQANSDIVNSVRWTSTLDARTSEICRLRDGLEYDADTHKPLGHSVPWLGGPGAAHWNCRSTAVPVVKSWRELGLDLNELSPSTRASMDGQVPADTTYAGWLKGQPAARQDEVLGATRGALFRRGELPLDKFYNDKGRYLSIDELRARDAAAFERANV